MKSVSGSLSREQLIKELDNLTEQVETLKESERNFKFLTENVEEVIFRYNLKNEKVIYITPSIYKLTGYTVEEVLKNSYKPFLTEEIFLVYKQSLLDRIEAYFNGDTQLRKRAVNVQLNCKNGNVIWVEITSVLIFNESGKVEEVVGILRDVTERKEIEKDRDNYKTIIDSSFEQTSVPMMLYEAPSNKLIIMNSASREILEVANETDFVGKTYNEFLKELDLYDSTGNLLTFDKRPIVLAFKGIPTKNKEIFFIKKDGTKRWALLTSVPIYNKENKLVAVFCVFPEITKIKEMEERLRKNAEELKTLNFSKDKFFSILAHDLRSPFQALLGISELLSNDIESLTQAEVVKFAGELHKAIKNQYDFLTHILEWARIQTNKVEFNPVRVSLFETTLKTFGLLKHSADSKQIELVAEIDKNLYVKADEHMLVSIIQNLVTNAIKFSRQNGNIRVAGNRINNYYEISVSDNGVGIDGESLSRLFNFDTMFTKKGTAGEKGSGLGLLICKEMIEKHGGKIWVQSKLNEGTKFTFSMPIYL